MVDPMANGLTKSSLPTRRHDTGLIPTKVVTAAPYRTSRTERLTLRGQAAGIATTGSQMCQRRRMSLYSLEAGLLLAVLAAISLSCDPHARAPAQSTLPPIAVVVSGSDRLWPPVNAHAALYTSTRGWQFLPSPHGLTHLLWVPSGRGLLLVGQGALWMLSLEGDGGGQLRRMPLPAGANPETASWRGARQASLTVAGRGTVWECQLNGDPWAHVPLNLPPAAVPLEIEWSPDGERAAVRAGFPDGRPSTLRLMRTDSAVSLPLQSPGMVSRQPKWSADGRWLAFATGVSMARGPVSVTLYDSRSNLIHSGPLGAAPCWAGGNVLFARPAHGGTEILRLWPDTGRSERVSIVHSDYRHAAVSPDGHWVAFEGGSSRRGQLCLLSLDSGAMTTIEGPYGGQPMRPTWRPMLDSSMSAGGRRASAMAETVR